MDFQTILSYGLALIETGALLITLVYLTKAMKERKKNKNSPAVKTYYTGAGIAVIVYLVLNVIRTTGLLG